MTLIAPPYLLATPFVDDTSGGQYDHSVLPVANNADDKSRTECHVHLRIKYLNNMDTIRYTISILIFNKIRYIEPPLARSVVICGH